jgi:hypothetical protein
MSEEKITTRCVQCDAEFTSAQLAGVKACPGCGTKSVPLDPDDDVTIRINKHELRLLTMWSSNYVDSIVAPNDRELEQKAAAQKTLVAVRRRLSAQLPELPLTLADEVRGIQATGVDAELLDGRGRVLVPRKGKPS